MQATQTLLEVIGRGDEAEGMAIVEREPEAARGTGAGGESPVLAAVYRGQMQLAQAIARHRQLDITEAAALGDARVVGELVRRDPGAVRARSQDGWTALHLAAFLGHAGIVRQLLDAGADIEATSENYMRNRPLHAALAGKGDPETVKLLVARDAEVEARAATGVTPLHTAASRGSVEFISLLLARGADRSARLDDGKTPAELAEQRGHPQAAALLTAAPGARS